MQRTILGIITAGLLVTGIALMLWPGVSDQTAQTGGVLVRAGTILAAVWFALPSVRRLPRWIIILLLSAGLLVILRPRLIVLALPVAIVVLLATGRTRSAERR